MNPLLRSTTSTTPKNIRNKIMSPISFPADAALRLYCPRVFIENPKSRPNLVPSPIKRKHASVRKQSRGAANQSSNERVATNRVEQKKTKRTKASFSLRRAQRDLRPSCSKFRRFGISLFVSIESFVFLVFFAVLLRPPTALTAEGAKTT